MSEENESKSPTFILFLVVLIDMIGFTLVIPFLTYFIQDLAELIVNYRSHLKAVYGLETFYGDETLHGLLEHAKSFNDYMETFEFIYSLTEEELQNDNTTNTENE